MEPEPSETPAPTLSDALRELQEAMARAGVPMAVLEEAIGRDHVIRLDDRMAKEVHHYLNTALKPVEAEFIQLANTTLHDPPCCLAAGYFFLKVHLYKTVPEEEMARIEEEVLPLIQEMFARLSTIPTSVTHHLIISQTFMLTAAAILRRVEESFEPSQAPAASGTPFALDLDEEA